MRIDSRTREGAILTPRRNEKWIHIHDVVKKNFIKLSVKIHI